MADAITDLTNGLPVEIGKIDRELKRLWKEGQGAATRASLMNFAVYCEGDDAVRETTNLISQITRDHACRAILIGLDPNQPGASVQACISAHCHLSRAGAKQVCCEQISFLMGRDGQGLIPNIVFSHLDSDLPLVLWWRCELPRDAEEQLWTWVDRLLYDSQVWQHPDEQFKLLRGSIVPASPRMTLCDLNWTRSLYLRQAVAQIFDHPEYLDVLADLSAVEIIHGAGMRSTAILMAGWMGAQLGWKLAGTDASGLRFTAHAGGTVAVTLREEAGRALGSIKLAAGSNTFLVAHREGSGYLHADIHLDGRDCHYLMPGDKGDAVSLLKDELMSGGKHKVYLKAVTVIEAALGR
ncbi:MAG TPA: glucose-6-phosphate dehydrogenase assembly protein OpcA [Chthoniobacteraceae bacterium]|jgi:glucose-6-phosphate dehydrogenase assembly protein OpcA|nr:glucose-6-phosphate dehydrogenase assembly protein OpcA [Chthoniobacteraceae bacterium]